MSITIVDMAMFFKLLLHRPYLPVFRRLDFDEFLDVCMTFVFSQCTAETVKGVSFSSRVE